MNTKGFTLTELIVTIALIGIISIIAFPAISKLKEDNELEKYKTYEKVMENGAKLYVDSKKEDIIWEDGKYKIRYTDLIGTGLVEAYQDSDIDCSKSYVCATKGNDGVVKYQTVLECKHGEKTLYNTNTELEKENKTTINC